MYSDTKTYLMTDIQRCIMQESELINSYAYHIESMYNRKDCDVKFKAECVKVFQQILNDKANHQKKLQKLFTDICSIEAAERPPERSPETIG